MGIVPDLWAMLDEYLYCLPGLGGHLLPCTQPPPALPWGTRALPGVLGHPCAAAEIQHGKPWINYIPPSSLGTQQPGWGAAEKGPGERVTQESSTSDPLGKCQLFASVNEDHDAPVYIQGFNTSIAVPRSGPCTSKSGEKGDSRSGEEQQG